MHDNTSPRFFFPDSPASARFLTPEERVLAIQRIKVNQTGVENKHFKREQWVLCYLCDVIELEQFGYRFFETLADPKTWLMALFAGIAFVHFFCFPCSLGC